MYSVLEDLDNYGYNLEDAMFGDHPGLRLDYLKVFCVGVPKATGEGLEGEISGYVDEMLKEIAL